MSESACCSSFHDATVFQKNNGFRKYKRQYKSKPLKLKGKETLPNKSSG
jgi:hypothetical protein